MSELVYYDFRIDAWRPDTLPLKRLAEYAAELAKLFGSTESVHLMKVRLGSATPEIAVRKSAQAAVDRRLSLVGGMDAPSDLRSAFRNLNQLLREDGAQASLRHKQGAKIIEFPGCKTPLSQEIVVHEDGALDGIVIRVGGTDETVPIWLEGEGRKKLKCTATRAIARELAKHLFGECIRVNGKGKWRRGEDQAWTLEGFVIKSWGLLESEDIEALVTRLRAVPGSGWNELPDAQAQWLTMRNDS